MMVQNRKFATDARANQLNPIQVLTENGYRIIRLCDVDPSFADSGFEHRFIVRDPDGYELDVAVSIDPQMAAEVIHRGQGRVTLESSFWINSAERHLAEYLWETNDFPPEGTLHITQPNLTDIDSAQRWSADSATRTIVTALFFLTCFFFPARMKAQQTVFNVPTTDVLDKGKVYFELDVSAKPNDGEAVKKFSSFVPRLVVGAGHHLEAGVNVLGNVQPGPDSTTIAPMIKWKFYDGKDNGWAMVLGENVFIPIRNRGYDAGSYTYAMTQKTFSKSTRIGFGGYFFSKDVVASNANRAGGQFTFEQPLNKKVTLAVDWLTGKHSAGYFSPGVIFKAGRKITGYASYSIGNRNASKGNHYFLLEFGYNFN